MSVTRFLIAMLILIVLGGLAYTMFTTRTKPPFVLLTVEPTLLQQYIEHPQPTPDYLIYAGSKVSNGSPLCVELNEIRLWNPGDGNGDQFYAVQKSLAVKINNVPLSDVLAGRGGATFSRPDGANGGFMHICVFTPDLPPDRYLASIEFSDTQGNQYSYTWVIEVTP